MDKLDLMNIALRIESTGYEGYSKIAESAEKNMKNFFLNLAKQEREHYEAFKKIFEKIEKKEEIRIWSDEENAGYWMSFAQVSIFPRIALNQPPRDMREAIEMAIASEKDSIIFYYGIKEYFTDQEEIKRIIKEEQKHLMDLLTLKR